MRNLCLIGLAMIVLLAAASGSYADVIHEDVAYWYMDNDGIGTRTEFNPNWLWLEQNTNKLLVKVQQTVYDKAQSSTILYRNGNGVVDGFLYAYSVTNLNVGDPTDLADMGITNFAVDWSVAPTLVTTSKQTLPSWVVDSPTQPSWKWTSTVDPGILPGETVGGLWAVSNTGFDGYVTAYANHGGSLNPSRLGGLTTGPIVPDAPTFISLAGGLMGLGLVRRFRRK